MLVVLAVTTTASLFFVDEILKLAMLPVAELLRSGKVVMNQAGPFDAFYIKFKTGLISGILAGVPFFIWQIWSFVGPALRGSETKALWRVMLFGSLLFMAGVALGYRALFMIIPVMLSFSVEGAQNIWQLQGYLNFVSQWLLISGIVFEIPLAIVIISRAGLIKVRTLKKGRPYAVILAFVAAAVLTPSPDAFTQIVVAVPMYMLYEAGILFAGLQKGGDDAIVDNPE